MYIYTNIYYIYNTISLKNRYNIIYIIIYKNKQLLSLVISESIYNTVLKLDILILLHYNT